MGNTIREASVEERYYYEQKRYHEQEEHRERMRVSQERQRASNEFWHSVEHKFMPSLYSLISNFLLYIFVIALLGIALWGISILFRKFQEHQKLKSEERLHMDRLKHESSRAEAKLKQEVDLKERELAQALELKHKELEQTAKFKELKLEQEKYISERNFRLEMGKLYYEIYKDAASRGQLDTLATSMTNFTQNMLIADQPVTSIEDISQLSMMVAMQGDTQTSQEVIYTGKSNGKGKYDTQHLPEVIYKGEGKSNGKGKYGSEKGKQKDKGKGDTRKDCNITAKVPSRQCENSASSSDQVWGGHRKGKTSNSRLMHRGSKSFKD